MTAIQLLNNAGNGVAETDIRSKMNEVIAATNAGGASLLQVKPPNLTIFPFEALGTGVTISKAEGATAFGMVRTDGGVGAVERIAFRGKAVPAGGAWDATMAFWPTPIGGTAKARSGLALHESATGKTLALWHDTESGTPQIFIFSYTDLNTISAVVLSGPVLQVGTFPVHFRVSYDGTNYIFKVSYDFMASWEVLATLAKATYFTTAADKVGLGLDTGNVQTAGTCRAAVFYYNDPDIL